jgi:hypothetical protein
MTVLEQIMQSDRISDAAKLIFSRRYREGQQEIYATGQAMAEGTSESSSHRRMEDASRSDESAD